MLVGTCFFGKGWGYLPKSLFADEFKNLSGENVKELYRDFSQHSIDVLLDYLKYSHIGSDFSKYLDPAKHDAVIVPLEHIFPGVIKKLEYENKICRKFAKATCFKFFTPETVCYHHGLKFLDANVIEYIKHKVFIDCGAFVGDSAYVFSQYAPHKIIAFEPSHKNCEICRGNLKKEKIDCVEIIQAALSDEPGQLYFSDAGAQTALSAERNGILVKVETIDEFVKQNNYENIGVIKADLEGMGLKMIRGAIKTIKRDRPVLLIAIYHNQDEFMGIYKFLKENISNYCYKIEALFGFSEITLIAYPENGIAH